MEIKIISLNMCHGNIGNDNIDVKKQADVIKKYNPDIVFLQEVDIYTDRCGNINEYAIFKEELQFKYGAVGSNIKFLNGWYGNAILSKFEILDSINYIKSNLKENKGLLFAKIKIDNKELDLFNTHLPVLETDRIDFVNEIIYKNIKNSNNCILGGDMNFGMIPKGNHIYDYDIKDKYIELEKLKEVISYIEFNELTHPVINPKIGIDKFLYKGNINIKSIRKLDENISDHFPVELVIEV